MTARLLLLAALTVLVTPVSAEIYQWKDEQGNVHFSDEPPPDAGTQTQRVTPETTGSTISTDSEEVRQRKARQREYLEQRRKERQREARQQAEREAEQAEQEARCREMKARLKHMESVSRFYLINDDGSRNYLSEEEAQKVRKRRHRQYEQRCG